MSQKETLKKVIRYIRKYGFFLVCSLVLAAVTVALTLYVPILVGDAIDQIIGPGDVDFAEIRAILWKIGIAVLITMAAQ